MGLPKGTITAVYRDSGVPNYQGNPLIEALPPIMSPKQIKHGLMGRIEFNSKDVFVDGSRRVHIIAQLFDDFFQPLSRHLELETKLSIMIRQGYVGRNLADGSLNMHMQNGYERLLAGDLDVFRFEQATSTARSLSLIGSSGVGKSTTLNRILSTYPQVLYHEQYNFTQVVYLKIDCPHDGGLKSLCINFFRAVDNVLHTDYERKYGLKKNGVTDMLAWMSQIASFHAIGVLVIDEIQHLSRERSGGVEEMLNFFVTLVNMIGLPVVMVGTPKARPIFEMNLRSARRGAGFGAVLWEPMTAPEPQIDPDTGQVKKTEWTAFTDKLWKYQWLQKRNELLSNEIRDCWYDLSQGVLDIVIKLFVLAQIRAIVTRTERITVQLMRRVYDDELKPVHPMLDALRSEDPERIAEFSDLTIPNVDIKILKLIEKIDADENGLEAPQYDGNDQAIRLHNLLVDMEYESDLIVPLVERAFKEHPTLTVRELLPIILEWERGQERKPESQIRKVLKIGQQDWHTLDSEDLRFLFSQGSKESPMYSQLQKSNMIFDVEALLNTMN